MMLTCEPCKYPSKFASGAMSIAVTAMPSVFTGPAADLNDHLAQRSALADVGERLGNLLERERAVDVDAHLPRDATVRERHEVIRTGFDGEDPQAPARHDADQRADRQHSQQGAHRSADDQVGATG